MTDGSVTHSWMKLPKHPIFCVRHITGFLLLGTLDSTSALHSEAVLNIKIKAPTKNDCFLKTQNQEGCGRSSIQLLSRVHLFATPWTAARQPSLSVTNSWSLPKLMSIVSLMPSNHLILCHPLLLPPSIFPNIRVFSNESALCNR